MSAPILCQSTTRATQRRFAGAHEGSDEWRLDRPVARARDVRYQPDDMPIARDLALVDLVLGVDRLRLPRARRDGSRNHPLGQVLETFARTLVTRVLRIRERWRVRRETRAVFRVLHGLDDRTLRDLGFHRCEIWSVAAEATGEAESTRMRTILRPRAPR
jgi:uncharacterized protein YjiS (DUF1127 family)